MGKQSVERQLSDVGRRLKLTREELAIADEQLGVLDDLADDARLRALVSETPLAESEHRERQRPADAMRRHRVALLAELGALEKRQDELLDRLTT